MPAEERALSRSKLYMIPLKRIVANTNPRFPLAPELEKEWCVMPVGAEVMNDLWLLGLSNNPEDRKRYVKVLQDGDPEFCAWATTFITQGQLEPVELRDNGAKPGQPNTYTLVFGARRCLAILYNWCLTGTPKEPLVEAKLTKGNNVTLMHRAVVENRRKAPNVIEEAKAIRFALNQGQKPEEVAEAYGWDKKTVKRYDSLLDLDEPIQKRLAAGTLTMAKALDRTKGEQESNGEPRPKTRSRKEITEAMQEFKKDGPEYRVLNWVLGLAEKI